MYLFIYLLILCCYLFICVYMYVYNVYPVSRGPGPRRLGALPPRRPSLPKVAHELFIVIRMIRMIVVIILIMIIIVIQIISILILIFKIVGVNCSVLRPGLRPRRRAHRAAGRMNVCN